MKLLKLKVRELEAREALAAAEYEQAQQAAIEIFDAAMQKNAPATIGTDSGEGFHAVFDAIRSLDWNRSRLARVRLELAFDRSKLMVQGGPGEIE